MRKVLLFLTGLVFSVTAYAQVPGVNTGSLKDQASGLKAEASSVGLSQFKKVAKDIPFEFNSAKLSLHDPKYKVGGYDIDTFMKKVLIPALAKVVNSLPQGKKVAIIGHANKVGPEERNANFVGNVILSKERAEAVLKYLIKNSDLNKDKFVIKAKGSSQPLSGVGPKSVKNCRVSFDIE